MHRRLFSLVALAPLLFSCQAVLRGDPPTQPFEGTGGASASGGTASIDAGSGGTGLPATGGTATGGSSNLGGTGGAPPIPDGTGPLCDVLALVRAKCDGCHGNPPTPRSVPMPLVTYDDLVAPAPSDATQSVAEMSLARMQDAKSPMPPAPATRATATDIATLKGWLDAGMPANCDAGSAGAAGTGGVVQNPYDTPTTCTSNTHWTGGDEESPNMHPGAACIDCHTNGGEEEGPRFTFAGTVFPSAHEPTDCNGLDGSAEQTEVVIVDANGATFTLKVNAVGNFSYEARGTTVALPYRAKVVSGGRERLMADAQESGDCNACHTENGTKDAPGRIMAP